MATLALVALLQAFTPSAVRPFTVWQHGRQRRAMGNWLKCFTTIAVMVTLVYARPYAAGARHASRRRAVHAGHVLRLLGMFVMISGNNFLVIYLGLELLTLSSYALVALAP
jgi:NADH-quinone oxidoreductase subunit N